MIEVYITKQKCKLNNKIFTSAYFVDVENNQYGLKRFISQEGEVGLCDSFDPVLDEIYSDIQSYFETELKKGYSKLTVNDAIRFFADLSQKGNQWYMESIDYTLDCMPKELSSFQITSDIISNEKIEVTPQQVTYNKWLSFSHEKKTIHMQFLFENPVSVFHPITNSIFHSDLKKKMI